MKPKINFLCIGTQKAGTTTLYDILKQHPNVYLPEHKEAPFFAYSSWYEKGEEWYYDRFFSNYNGEKAVGTISPDYLVYPKTAERTRSATDDNLKIIVILRNPAERAVSHYNMTKARLVENLNFFDALAQEDTRLLHANEEEFMHYTYVARGLYYKQLTRWLNLFPKENFLFLDFDKDIRHNIDESIKQILKFIDVEEIELNTNIHSFEAWEYKYKDLIQSKFFNTNKIGTTLRNIIPWSIKRVLKIKIFSKQVKSKNKFQLNDQEKKVIVDKYFREDIEKLSKLLKRDFSHWLQ